MQVIKRRVKHLQHTPQANIVWVKCCHVKPNLQYNLISNTMLHNVNIFFSMLIFAYDKQLQRKETIKKLKKFQVTKSWAKHQNKLGKTK